jgi:hypothetical protein
MRLPGATIPVSLAVTVLALSLTASDAHAQYLDPGAGSIIVQAVIAVAIGAATAAKLYWRRISTFLSSRRNKGTTPT